MRSLVGIQIRIVQQMMPKVPLVSGPGDKKSADKEACHDPEEACDEDKFGDENKGPTQSECWKPLLPLALSGSTILGGVTVTLVHVPLLTELTAWPWSVFVAIVLAIYGPTLLCMLWVARADPGQITIEDGETPKRTHKSWLYPEPIRRYDHYCRWLQNVVGLMNHREFMAMLIGLTLIAVLGVIMDPACPCCLGLQKSRGRDRDGYHPCVALDIFLDCIVLRRGNLHHPRGACLEERDSAGMEAEQILRGTRHLKGGQHPRGELVRLGRVQRAIGQRRIRLLAGDKLLRQRLPDELFQLLV